MLVAPVRCSNAAAVPATVRCINAATVPAPVRCSNAHTIPAPGRCSNAATVPPPVRCSNATTVPVPMLDHDEQHSPSTFIITFPTCHKSRPPCICFKSRLCPRINLDFCNAAGRSHFAAGWFLFVEEIGKMFDHLVALNVQNWLGSALIYHYLSNVILPK